VGKKSSIALGAVGVVLVILAIVWWAAIAPSLTKLPGDIDTSMNFEGTLTQYVDSATGQPLPAGKEVVVPLTVVRNFATVPDMTTSSTEICLDSILMTVAGQERPPQLTQYALDRKTRKCVESNENWAYSPQIVMSDRVGNYGPLFPGGLKVGDTVSAFFNDPATAFDVKAAEKIEDYNGLGITVMKMDASRPATEYYPPIAQAVLGAQGLPMELTFAQLSAQLKAKGLDLEALMAGLAAVAAPEDLQKLQAMTGQPVKVIYKQESGDVTYIDQKTGATVGAAFDRTTTMQVDTSGLLGAFAIIGKYASDPTVGPAIAAAMQAAGGLATAAPTTVFNQSMSIIPASEASLAKEAKDKASLLDLANLWIPLIIVIVGAVLLLLGAYLLLRARKASPTPAKTN
jgi:hypothetical protein